MKPLRQPFKDQHDGLLDSVILATEQLSTPSMSSLGQPTAAEVADGTGQLTKRSPRACTSQMSGQEQSRKTRNHPRTPRSSPKRNPRLDPRLRHGLRRRLSWGATTASHRQSPLFPADRPARAFTKMTGLLPQLCKNRRALCFPQALLSSNRQFLPNKLTQQAACQTNTAFTPSIGSQPCPFLLLVATTRYPIW